MTSRGQSAARIGIALAAVLVLVFALPQNLRSGLPGPLGSADFRLGLDLAGGTQLDFRISETEMDEQEVRLKKELADLETAGGDAERIGELQLELSVLSQQRANLVEAIRTVLERRINSLGVSEATITPSYAGAEKHLLVECPGVVDVQQCIATVGKTIRLEFKEEQTEVTPAFRSEVRAKATAALARIRRNESTVEKTGQDLGSELGVAYQPGGWFFRDTLPKGLQSLWNVRPGTVVSLEGAVSQTLQDPTTGAPVEREIPGVFIAELLLPRTQTGRVLTEAPSAFALLASQEPGLRAGVLEKVSLATQPQAVQTAVAAIQPGQMALAKIDATTAQVVFLRYAEQGREEMRASHILIAYGGASGAPAGVTRTKEEAKALAERLRAELRGGADFAVLARQSDAESKATGGSLGSIARGTMVASFEQVAFALPQGGISDVVETPFGFHIIRSDSAPALTPTIVSLDTLTVTGAGAADRATDIITRLQTGQVTRSEDALRVRFLFFSLEPVGWQDTPLDGKHFRSAAVVPDPTTGLPVVQIAFDSEGGALFQELTRRNIGKQIAIFVGGELVSAPTVQAEIAGGTAVITGSQNFSEAQALAQDLNTGAIPAPIHLSGQRTVEPTLGAEALRTSLQAGVYGGLALMLFLIVVYRLLGVLASVSLVAYAGIFLALLKLPLFLVTDQYIVLTLAGIAGMMLSVGLAVDANVLIFERLREELQKGRSFRQAAELGFERAWPSIRDTNISTLITCAILFTIGTSIVRGFAATLSLGIVISLLTSVVLTRALARLVARLPMAEDHRWFLWSTKRDR